MYITVFSILVRGYQRLSIMAIHRKQHHDFTIQLSTKNCDSVELKYLLHLEPQCADCITCHAIYYTELLHWTVILYYCILGRERVKLNHCCTQLQKKKKKLLERNAIEAFKLRDTLLLHWHYFLIKIAINTKNHSYDHK